MLQRLSYRFLPILLLIAALLLSACGDRSYEAAYVIKQQQTRLYQLLDHKSHLQFNIKRVWQGDTQGMESLQTQKNEISSIISSFNSDYDCKASVAVADYIDVVAKTASPWSEFLDQLEQNLAHSERAQKIRRALSALNRDLDRYIQLVGENTKLVASLRASKENARILLALSNLAIVTGKMKISVSHLLTENLFAEDIVFPMLKSAYSIRRKLDTLLDGNKRFSVAAVRGKAVRKILGGLRESYLGFGIEQIDDLYAKTAELSTVRGELSSSLNEIDKITRSAITIAEKTLTASPDNGAGLGPACEGDYSGAQWLDSIRGVFSS